MQPILSVTLPIELTNGNGGRGSKWFQSAKRRKDYEALLCRLGAVREPFGCPVALRVTRVYSGRQRAWDASSIGRGNWKEIEDALVACGWFHDDGPKWITKVEFVQMKGEASMTGVEIFEAGETP